MPKCLYFQHPGPKLFANHFKRLGQIPSNFWSGVAREIEFSWRTVDYKLDTQTQSGEMTGKRRERNAY